MKTQLSVNSVRLTCTGNTSGPSLYHPLEVLGKEMVMERIEKAHTTEFK
ncbi:MAG: hypothetical protein ABIQ35_01500 [Verrucomicrobiota bacterium]